MENQQQQKVYKIALGNQTERKVIYFKRVSKVDENKWNEQSPISANAYKTYVNAADFNEQGDGEDARNNGNNRISGNLLVP